MISRTTWVASASLLVLLAGCGSNGYYYDRNSEYVDAKMVAPLSLPEGARQGASQDAMPVPRVNGDFVQGKDGFKVPRPQPMMSKGDQRDFAQLRNEDGDSWLLVNAAPAAVWPRLQDFASRAGYGIQEVDPARGRIQTRQGELTLVQGIRSNSTRVECTQGDSVNAACLKDLAGYLSQTVSQQGEGVSLAGQNLSDDNTVVLENRQGQWQLNIAQGFSSTWAEMAYQLEHSFSSDNGARLVDQDRSARTFTVTYTPSTASGSGWWIFGSGPDPREYRLELAPRDQQVVVTATRTDGQPIEQGEARELLDRVASTLR
ncbi:outer membrane protein assembly factor BamC [Larsenimonas rhizosphaerae]|uniref:Outer membrane protein assembly factor BamC n=1 Tax=Larsenimonas rhizosphaerae TaxID=2944682 RepID=A0AA41ZE45_9GAMM|nr:outer membrane protein assembly factor BamC [Larsenimonas rhizosphaerae]MCM2130118.1 outer membrane protein assembly factor BamC [Larsenimonas rhizosphaerae]MCX2522805.1 outer membrane protein assembly factor BamC [Larsenimonas rhizosphaerae]